MRLPGIEPGLKAVSRLLKEGRWEASVIAAGPQPHCCFDARFQSDRAGGEMDTPSRGVTLAVLDHSRTTTDYFWLITRQAIYGLCFMHENSEEQ